MSAEIGRLSICTNAACAARRDLGAGGVSSLLNCRVDADAVFDREVVIDGTIIPRVTWGISP